MQLGKGFGGVRHALGIALVAVGAFTTWQIGAVVGLALIASSICSRLGVIMEAPPERPPTTAGKTERTPFST
jgi:hypothetical protein